MSFCSDEGSTEATQTWQETTAAGWSTSPGHAAGSDSGEPLCVEEDSLRGAGTADPGRQLTSEGRQQAGSSDPKGQFATKSRQQDAGSCGPERQAAVADQAATEDHRQEEDSFLLGGHETVAETSLQEAATSEAERRQGPSADGRVDEDRLQSAAISGGRR